MAVERVPTFAGQSAKLLPGRHGTEADGARIAAGKSGIGLEAIESQIVGAWRAAMSA